MDSRQMRIRCVVTGHVQGVFYRYATLKQAQSLGVTGWVRNVQANVEVVLCGGKNQVEQMLAWMRHGPVDAQVDDIEVTPWDDGEVFKDFSIR